MRVIANNNIPKYQNCGKVETGHTVLNLKLFIFTCNTQLEIVMQLIHGNKAYFK